MRFMDGSRCTAQVCVAPARMMAFLRDVGACGPGEVFPGRALVRHISRVFGCAVRTYFRLYPWVHAHAVVGTAPVGAGTHVLRQLPPRRP